MLSKKTDKILEEWLEFEVPYIFDKGMQEHRGQLKIVAVMAKKLDTWFCLIRT